jgi:hypothetical protein
LVGNRFREVAGKFGLGLSTIAGTVEALSFYVKSMGESMVRDAGQLNLFQAVFRQQLGSRRIALRC